ncbi:hypothetical protein DCS_07868 [Drechmeria coniospora]|uniref:JmjC domain-containing protein n=1 Tax=Drechmeria coniospora TaxID=98403 RepID=A0A151GFM5_DRECN|nr:hypothetical protein DCS_07868 [Drechmeria coniospora]KYK55903.1 hypothetical protein DCS_07868 [Drechmeria coniospora]
MPTSLHPQAKFDPIPPDLDLHGLVDQTPNFKWVQRVSRAQIRSLGQHEFERLVHTHVIVGGKPLVIDGWDVVLPTWLFSAKWMENTYDKKQENVRDIPAATDIPMTTGHYLRSMKQLTNQWTPHTYRDERRQRLYLKDIDCPPEWRDALQRVIHPSLFYLNENVTTTGGSGCQDDDAFRGETTAAPAGDLMSSLPEEMRAENLMCYIGHEGTYTPAHREMCASIGQNIMIEASGDGAGEKRGSSIWFMTESKDREVVREYFLSMLGHDIEIEKHFAQINAWKKAPFDVYIVEQRPGDFILIPPLAAHQVWNRGTRTMKVAWNRTTTESLDLALHEALPKARLVCRDEQYKNKAIVYFTLQKYHAELRKMEENLEVTQTSFIGIGHDLVRNSPRAKQLTGEFRKLLGLYSEILVDEVFLFKERDVELLPFDSCITCSYCRSNIFNRFLTCKQCVRTLVTGEEDAYDVCMECYAMGRSCACLSGLQWCEQWTWTDLVDKYESWRAVVIMNDGYIDVGSSPPPFEVARQKSGKKSVAQICQEALRRRPWKDITKPEREPTPSDSDQGVGGDKVKKKPKRKKKKGDIRRCHVCCHKDYSYRVHECTNPGCAEGYCYGVLYRAFDMMPQRVLEDEYWQCPKCLGICSCGSCRRSGNPNAYTPKNTLLGHDTRPIADDRSVEALVDFRIHNLSWLKAVGEESRSKDSRRMQRLREQADSAKAQDLTRQVEAEQVIHDEGGPGAARVTNIMSTEHSAGNGYGDQSEIVDRHASSLSDFATCAELAHDDEGTILPVQAEALARSSDAVDPNTSSYPDPTVLVRQRIGMGYYEQDDTPDKILFDPYQLPSAESMKLPELDVPEVVQKSIRAAKRKARRENDDPDFVVGKSYHKKPRLAQQADLLESMDPALFDSAAVSMTPVHDHGAGFELQPHRSSELHGENPDGASQKRQKMVDANEPALRHAKPTTSYIESEDADLNDMEDDNASSRSARQHEAGVKPIHNDLTRAAIGAVTDHIPQSNDLLASMGKVHKRRGRPPKRQSLAMSSPIDGEAQETQSTPSRNFPNNGRSRGRPPRSDAFATRTASEITAPGAAQHASGNDKEHDEIAVEIAVQLENLATEVPLRRSRRFGVTTIVAATAEFEAEADSDVEAPPERESHTSDREVTTGPRRRGRPRRSDTATHKPSVRRRSMPLNHQYMSMAERMALKGKNFKIGKRASRSTPPVAYTALPVPVRIERTMAEIPSSHGEVPLTSRVRPGSSRNGPNDSSSSENQILSRKATSTREDDSQSGNRTNAIRLADLDTDNSLENGLPRSASSSGDDDIPSGRRSPGPVGRSKTRGDVRGRGGSRGRPRGRARAGARARLRD